ncbi:tyrosine-type recombinase/integrase [Roseococcus sp. XZZS9]|uniref:Tyrosine-type recombinase/integrase n=1 Tax=Roseococcus pinisoli TaxID=2835040 RepID=A0ABS5QCD1_9PROT|nr:tyrosine-type recombinase/integrase [Roseococcus pinisoli]
MTEHFGDTPLDEINQASVGVAVDAILRPGAAASTVVRNIIVPVRAVMSHAAWMGWGPEPRIKSPELEEATPKPQTPETVALMIERAPPAFRPLVVWFACTGCRVGETLTLDWAQVDLSARLAILLPETTKAGKRRVVDLYPAAVAMLAALPHREGRVFRRVDREPYRASDNGGGQLRTPWATTCQRAGVGGRWQEWKVAGRPKRRWIPEIGPHALRHTWASWHHVIHKDLLRLRDDGGWASVGQVECYAHSLPGHHAASIRQIWGLTPQWQRNSSVA